MSLSKAEATTFPDIYGHWAEQEINTLIHENIVNGYEDGNFHPENNITVEEFVKLMITGLKSAEERYEIESLSRSSANWFEPYEREASALGFLEDESFTNNKKNITRFQMAYILNKATQSEIDRISDVNMKNVYRDSDAFFRHENSIKSVYRKGLMRGLPNDRFGGHRKATRAEAAVIVNRMIDSEKRIVPEESFILKAQGRKQIEVPVLMYHHFTERPSNSSMITPQTAKQHIEYILSLGYEFIGLDDLYKYLAHEQVYMPEKPIILTVDDGYLSVYEELFPLAKEYNIKISLAPIGLNIGARNKNLPNFGWEEMREMKATGLVEFQNHTYDLHYPREMIGVEGTRVSFGVMGLIDEHFPQYAKRLLGDWSRLESEFERELGSRSNFIVYPYGSYTASTEVIAKEMFKGSLSIVRGTRVFHTLDDLWAIPRYNITEDTDLRNFLSLSD